MIVVSLDKYVGFAMIVKEPVGVKSIIRSEEKVGEQQ